MEFENSFECHKSRTPDQYGADLLEHGAAAQAAHAQSTDCSKNAQEDERRGEKARRRNKISSSREKRREDRRSEKEGSTKAKAREESRAGGQQQKAAGALDLLARRKRGSRVHEHTAAENPLP